MSERFPFTPVTQTKEETMMKVNVSGTHKENMAAINNAEISEGFKAHIRMELKKHYDSIDNVPDDPNPNERKENKALTFSPWHGILTL